ncbi:MAG: hypothetical protein GWP10_09930 [Nitrospiraceae bacterium]|nr:hypothetical protein [Nitrospiraceae bacterium]
MKIADVIEGLVRKIKKQDDLDIEKEIGDLLSDEEMPEEDVPDREPESGYKGGWVQAIEDKDDADDPSFEDDPSSAAKGEEGEESDEWIQQDDDTTDLQAFGQGGSDATREDTLLTELKMDDELADQEEHEMLEYLEVVGADELVRDMNDIIRESRRRNT